MTTFNTGNPLDSGDPRDLFDNSQIIDNYVSSLELTTIDRLGQIRKTWRGVELDSAIGSYVVRTIDQLTAITPPVDITNPSGRVTEGPGAGYYVWENGAWSETVDPLLVLFNSTNNVFVPYERDGAVSEAPSDFMNCVRAVFIEGGYDRKDYKLDYFQNFDPRLTPVTEGFVLTEFDEGTWNNPRQAIGRTQPLSEPINRELDVQVVTVESSSGDMRMHLVLIPSNMPPSGTQLRSNQVGDPGYSYKVSRTAVEPAHADVELNGKVFYPFVSRARGGVPAATEINALVTPWLYPIVDFRVENADPDYFYYVSGIYPPGHSNYPCSWIIQRQLRAGFESDLPDSNNQNRLITYVDSTPVYERNTGLQTVFLTHSRAQEKFYITLDTNKIPSSGFYGATLPDSSEGAGFTYIVHPSRYTFGEPKQSAPQPINLLKNGERVNMTWNRNENYDFTIEVRPNGFNDLYNIRYMRSTRLSDGSSKILMETSSDSFPPLRIMSLESNVDVWTPSDDRPATGYTGGNHGAGAGSFGGAAGSQSAEMQYLKHYADGVLIQSDAAVMSINEHASEHLNKLRAWNTIDVNRFVLDQKFRIVTRKNVMHVWCEVTALENIEISSDNGLQLFSEGWDTILFLNGENRTSRVDIDAASGLTPGPASTTGKDCFAVSLKGDNISGNQFAWIDRDYGHGDGRGIGGTAGYFRRGTGTNTKVYAGMVANKSLIMAPGDKYVWHMAAIWSGLEDDAAIDSAAVFENGDQVTLLYSKLNGSTGQIKNNLEMGNYVDGKMIDINGVTVSDPAGGYQFPVISEALHKLEIEAGDSLVESKAYTDAAVGVLEPFIIPQALPPETDLNNVKTAGVYYSNLNATVATWINCPISVACIVKVDVADPDGVEQSSFVYQTVTSYTGNSSYRRTLYLDGWSVWLKDASINDVAAGDAETLISANQHTDTEVSGAVTESNQYTDTRETLIREDFASADDATLADANSHTDEKVGAVETFVLPQQLGTGVDLNNLKTSGTYFSNSSTVVASWLNCPVTSACTVDVVAADVTGTTTGASFVYQTVTPYFTAASNRTYKRTLYEGVWGAWLMQATSQDAVDAGAAAVSTANQYTDSRELVIRKDGPYLRNKGAEYPFVQRTRLDTTSPSNSNFNNAILDAVVYGYVQGSGKIYKLRSFVNNDPVLTGVGADPYGIRIEEFDEATYATTGVNSGVDVVNRVDPQTPWVRGGIQEFLYSSLTKPGLQFKFIIDTDALPPEGTRIDASSQAAAGFSWIIDPNVYVPTELAGKLYTDSREVAAVDAANAHSDTIAKYGMVPDKVWSASEPLPLAAARFTYSVVDGVMRFTPSGVAGTGYAYNNFNFAPAGKVFRYRIRRVSGSEKRAYVANILGTTDATVNRYGTEVENLEDSFATYDVKLDKRGDGSDWVVGEIVKQVQVPLTAGDSSSVWEIEWAAIGTPYNEAANQVFPAVVVPPVVTTDFKAGVYFDYNDATKIISYAYPSGAEMYKVGFGVNGTNGLPNLISIHKAPLGDPATAVWTLLSSVSTDYLPPMVFRAVNNVDSGPSIYTGGNHGADPETGLGDPTARNNLFKVFADGKLLTANAKGYCDSIQALVVNELYAYNTITLGRYALQQSFAADMSGSGMEVHAYIKALEDIVVSTDNGPQHYFGGFVETMLYVGGYPFARAALDPATNSGPKSENPDVWALLTKSVNGTMASWMDRDYEAGDGRYVAPTSAFIRGGGAGRAKFYHAAVAAQPATLAAGEGYKWRGGYHFFSDTATADFDTSMCLTFRRTKQVFAVDLLGQYIEI